MSDSIFLLGLLGLMQVIVLPGHLLARALRLDHGIIDGLLVAFGLSVLLNSILVQTLVYFHAFTRPVMLWIIAVECAAIVRLWWWSESGNRWARSRLAYRDAVAAWGGLASPERLVVVGTGALALYCAVALVHSATSAWQDEAFTLWDNVFSWNRWATEWAANGFPIKTYHYPQLLPTNSSIIYVLTGTTTVQAFNRLFFAFFPVYLILGLIDLGLRRCEIGFWLGIPLVYLAWIFMARPFPAEGYADVPATFLILLAVYCAFIANESTEARLVPRWMIASGLAAGAAMSTKQTGIVILLALPVLLIVLVRGRDDFTPSQKRRALLYACVAAILVSVPWYVIKEIQIRSGLDQSEVTGITIAHGGRGLIQRVQNGIGHMFSAWGVVPTLAVATLALLSGFLRTPWRWVTWLIVLPGFLIWSITTSYDLRNSNFVVVLGCVSAGLAGGQLLLWARRFSHSWRPQVILALLAVLAAVGCAWLSTLPSVSNVSLKQRSKQAQQTIAMPELNSALLRLVAEHKINRPVVTNYFVMPFIPVLKDYYVYESLMEPAAFDALMKRAKPEYIVVIHPSQNYPAVSEQVVATYFAKGLWSIAEVGGSFLIIQVHETPLPVEQRKFNFGVFRTIEGLAPEEGPYPQWDMPVVRWGLGPATRLEFNAPTDTTFEFTVGIQHAPTILTMEILLNDALIATMEITSESNGKTVRHLLNARAGTNQIELRYSTWDTKTEARPLAILFRSIHLLPKEN